MVLLEEKYIYRYKMYNHYDSQKGFGTGLYLFKKEIEACLSTNRR
jgi:hypothetical protein